jgi:hypothetical protein
MALKGVIATGFFRTGSTFFFSCLRQVAEFRCYYEPYHPELLEFVEALGEPSAGPDRELLGHSIGDDYFAEFKGVDLTSLKKVYAMERRVTNQPVLHQGSSHKDLYNYIHFLQKFASEHGQISVLQANRLNFSMPWLKQNFPDYLLILITRKPQSVFASLKSLALKEGRVLRADDVGSDYWNVKEAFENIVKCHGIFKRDFVDFGYYQKLFFLLKFSERVMAENADLVLSYEHFLEKPEPIFDNLAKAFNINTSASIDYVKQHAFIDKKSLPDKYLSELEKSVVPLLNEVAKNTYSVVN